ncbi:hypothetical protein G7092_27565 [Mucilaginibacter sp. HC2]|nr:hypothetical protein [Mucilaginibacter inviolabilis]
MKTLLSELPYLATIFCIIFLFVFGFFAVFHPKKIIDLRIKYSFSKEFIKKMSEERWFMINLKIGGVICMIISLALLTYCISVLVSHA